MWKMQRKGDGSYTPRIEDNVWTATLPLASIAEARSRLRGPELVAAREGDGFSLRLDGKVIGAFGSMLEAHEEGYRMEIAREASMQGDAFASTGLSAERWIFAGGRFLGRENLDEVIHVGKSPRNFSAALGGVRLGDHETASAAEAAIDDMPHLSNELLEALEKAYEGGFDGHHPSHYADWEDAGYVARSGDGAVTLTDAGREVLESDPRAMSTRVRDVLFDAVAARSVGRTDEDGEPLAEMTAAEARLAFNPYFRQRLDNVEGLKMLLANPGLDVRVEYAGTEPHEVMVVGSGDMADGSYTLESTLLLLSPDWVEDDCRLLAEAAVECRDELIAAHGPEGGTPAP